MRQTLRQVGREWVIALACYGLLVAPFGCQVQTDLFGDGGDNTGNNDSGGGLDTKSAGLFVNPDESDPLILAGRNEAGDAFFVYGTRQSNGGIGEVDSILLQTADGEESLIAFDLGRPVLLKGPDGSFIKITYEEVSASRIAASAELYDASTGTTQTKDIDIDLQETAEQVAQTIEQLTGQTLVVPTVPPSVTTKSLNRARGPLLTALIMVPMVVLTEAMIVIVGQMMAEMMADMATAVRNAVIIACSPLLLFADLLGEVSVEIDEVPLFDVFIDLPPPPVIDIVLH
jgi:hypothetical protein